MRALVPSHGEGRAQPLRFNQRDDHKKKWATNFQDILQKGDGKENGGLHGEIDGGGGQEARET